MAAMTQQRTYRTAAWRRDVCLSTTIEFKCRRC
jgi:hypothetical protein